MLDQPQYYEIRIQGHIDAHRLRWFEGVTVVCLPEGQTLISGPFVDQSALHSLLNRISDWGLPLLLVKRIGEDV